MSPSGALDDLIRRARRRCLSNLLFRQTTEAMCVAMGGLILLLVLGTEILDARWLAALFAVSFLVGFRNLRARMPSRYRIAQEVDRNVVLHDALSTAFFYNRMQPARKAQEEIREAQFTQAERLAREVRVERAFPYCAPKSLYLMSLLGLIASSLIAVRYGISHRLDLRPPLARVIFDVFHFADSPQQAAKKNPPPKRVDDLLKQFGLSLDEQGAKKAQGPEQSDPAQTLQQTESRQPSEADRLKQQGISLDPQNQKQGEENSESASNGASEQGDQERAGAAESDSANDAGRQQAANSQNENNSLLQKFRDAMANLLSRLKTQPNGQSQQMAKGEGRQDASQRQQSAGQKGGQQMAGRQSDPSRGQPQGQQEGEGNQKAQAGSGKQSGNEAERASQEGRSGIGKEDGSKAVREAEQLAAMGKISEILGKRSQNLTGEVMVEVNAGKEQQLRTAYSQQSAAHSDAGGEIHRDEIPLAYQRYVQQYFDEIRKAAPPKPPAQP